MGRPEKPIDADGAVAAFASRLRRLRARAGNLTYREMARAALYSPSVLSSAASGHRLPTLQVTLAFVAACGGDQEEWRQRWLKVSGRTNPQVATPPRRRESANHPVLPPPAQLPVRPRGLVGRDSECGLLGERAAVPIVICGPVGVGKSAFALDYAHQIAGEITDGQLYADLGSPSCDEQTVLRSFLRALGITVEQLPEATDQQAGMFRSILAERRLLVLLDNVRDERQVRSLLAETRSGTMILVGRNPLLGLRDVRRVRLDVLPRDDSIKMICTALSGKIEADLLDCHRLAELCSDLPLAIDIAVRKLVARPDLPLTRITRGPADPGALLDWLRIGDVSLPDLLNSAYLQLGAAARTLLQELALCAPDELAADAAELVSKVPMDEAAVDELTAAGLLYHDDHAGAYRLDPLVRAFAARYATRQMIETSVTG